VAKLVGASAYDRTAMPGRTAISVRKVCHGRVVYSLDCKALKAENKDINYKPDMPATNLPETVIPQSGKVQTPETTPTKAK
jgi:hypothetical protein